MILRITTILLLAVCLSLSVSADSTISVIDDKGQLVKLNKPANRIISLAPHITETLFAAGAGDKIVGTIAHSDYPAAAKKITRIGGYPSADIEKIISLQPDLLIVWPSANNLKQIEQLHKFGISVYRSEPRVPEDIIKNIVNFGILSGTNNIARKSAAKYTKKLKHLEKNYSNKRNIKLFYQLWNKPIITINDDHLISKIINLCGGTNVFASLPSLTPNVSVESVISSNTDIILAGAKKDKYQQWENEWQSWLPLAANKKGKKLYFINPDLLNRAGPRIFEGADELCRLLDSIRSNL